MVNIGWKLADIAGILGLSESECRSIAEEYEAILTCNKIGKVRVYDENMVERFRKIADLRTQGLPQEVITTAIKGDKTLEERALDDMKRMGIPHPKESKIPDQKLPPRSELEKELIIAVHSVETVVQKMDYRVAAIREKIANDNTAVLDAIAGVAKEVASLRSDVHTLWDQIASLEQYFRVQNDQKKFWFWRR
ncbi:MAG TPA: hypothetical protein O0W88_02840 [Methanocorpusculum sp.]|nr:hypothetical protein [Methanocorpusculum sp.]